MFCDKYSPWSSVLEKIVAQPQLCLWCLAGGVCLTEEGAQWRGFLGSLVAHDAYPEQR